MGSLRRFALRLLSLVRAHRAETDLAREIQAHLQLLEDQFVQSGMSAADARAAARRAFGGVEQVKERQRDARSFRLLAGWPMDLKLGARMFVKYPGLTIVAVIALSVSIGAGAGFMEFVTDLVNPTLPVEDGDRIVGIVNWDAASGQANRRAMHDFMQWRREVTSVVDLGAGHSLQRNLITEDGRSEAVKGAAITASAFRVIPTRPLLGRVLVADDERPESPAVVVIGEALWDKRFNRDPSILGREIRLGRTSYHVVGVMPRSFGFPANHTLWVPLRATTEYRHGEGPEIMVFGRLAPGSGLGRAQAELTAIADRASANAPGDSARLRPLVKPYVSAIWAGIEDGALQRTILYSANLLFLGLLGICGANVATLVFARTVTREAEITVRTALGASRGRIVSQFFAEALVLSSTALIAGLAIASFASRWAKATFMEAQDSAPPFWLTDQLAPGTWAYAALLAVVAAALIGIIPALKATGPALQSRLKNAGAAAAGMKFGGIWTGVIVTQVAITVLFLMTVVSVGWNAYTGPFAMGTFAFHGEDYLSLRLEMDRDNTPAASIEPAQADFRGRYRAAFREIERRLELEPDVAAVTSTTQLPTRGSEFMLEMDSSVSLPPRGHDHPLWVRSASVGPDFFETFDAPILTGRGFTIAEADLLRPVAIVDQTFVRTVLGGRDAVGLRLRQKQGPEKSAAPWIEIVGVVRDLTNKAAKTSEDAMLYRPAAPGAVGSTQMVVRARGTAASLPATVGRVAAEADPTLRLYEVMPLEDMRRADGIAFGFFLRVLSVVSAVALLLSMAGVYALMSFTLSRRTREIGIRVALGAAPRRIVSTIFSRALAQIGLGILAGCVPGFLLVAQESELARGAGAGLAAVATVSIAAFIAGVTMLACWAPARRALRIQPTEALRDG